MDADELIDFPVLTIDFLKDLTFGVYQVGLAPSYIQDKLQRDGDGELQVEMLQGVNRLPEPGLLRIRVYSRFRNATRYQLWISYTPAGDHGRLEDDELGPIQGYYCTCKPGARTLGVCAHVTSVLWYMGYARHEERVSYPSQILLDIVRDAGDRPRQVNP